MIPSSRCETIRRTLRTMHNHSDRTADLGSHPCTRRPTSLLAHVSLTDRQCQVLCNWLDLWQLTLTSTHPRSDCSPCHRPTSLHLQVTLHTTWYLRDMITRPCSPTCATPRAPNI